MNKFYKRLMAGAVAVACAATISSMDSRKLSSVELGNDGLTNSGTVGVLQDNKGAAKLEVVSSNIDKVNRLQQVINILNYVITEYETKGANSGITLKEYNDAKRDMEIAILELDIAEKALEEENKTIDKKGEIISINADIVNKLQPMLDVIDYVIADYEKNKELSIITKKGYEQAIQKREQVIAEIEIAKKGLDVGNKQTNEAEVISQKEIIVRKLQEILEEIDYAIAEYEKNGENGVISNYGYEQAKAEREKIIAELERTSKQLIKEENVSFMQ